MRRIFSVVIVVMMIAAGVGCSKNKKGDITVVFKGTYGSAPLVMLDNYSYAFGQKIQFTKSDFYLSNVVLASPSGLPEVLTEVELVDLSFTNEEDAMTGFEFTIKDVPESSYNRFNFAIGLDQVTNATMPEDWPPSSPLSEQRYWDGESSYIFAKTEGNLDTLGTGDADLKWSYHTGSDRLYVSLSTNTTLTINNGETTRIVFTVDHKELLGVGSNPIDIKSNPINIDLKDSVEITQIAGNYEKAITFVIE